MRANIGRAELKRGFIELGSSRGTGRSALANCVSGNQATSGITGFQFRGPPAERRARRPQPPAETGHAESPLVKLVGSIFIGAPGIPGGLNAAPTNIYFSCFARARARQDRASPSIYPTLSSNKSIFPAPLFHGRCYDPRA